MKNIKICAFSDPHGDLPEIEPCDICFICGDIVPLDAQRDSYLSEDWFTHSFFDWARYNPANKIYFIAGNHDFYLMMMHKTAMNNLIKEYGLENKLVYIEDEVITDNETGLNICGIPWTTGPANWAFYAVEPEKKYNKIALADIDILLTHQPPKVGKVGASYPNQAWERQFGSEELTEAISISDVKYNFCGHIHSGDHNENILEGTKIYNVSLKDEDYHSVYKPLYLNIKKEGEI